MALQLLSVAAGSYLSGGSTALPTRPFTLLSAEAQCVRSQHGAADFDQHPHPLHVHSQLPWSSDCTSMSSELMKSGRICPDAPSFSP